MATNFEFYKDEILDFSIDDIAVTKDGKVQSCCTTECSNCIFYAGENHCLEPEEIKKFFYSEHVYQPKLTKRERAFCEAVQTGWIARDCDMFLYYFDHKPILNRGEWDAEGYHVNMMVLGLKDSFMFIKDTDAECWSIEDLLKLEVQHETD